MRTFGTGMTKHLFRYLSLLALYAISVFLMAGGAAASLPSLFTDRFLLQTGVYFYAVTALFHIGLVRSSAGKPAAFIRYYMGATTIKLFLHLGVLVACLFRFEADTFRFGLTFMFHYVFFTVFEVVAAYRSKDAR